MEDCAYLNALEDSLIKATDRLLSEAMDIAAKYDKRGQWQWAYDHHHDEFTQAWIADVRILAEAIRRENERLGLT